MDQTLQEARDRYFAVNGFGADGGYNKRWEKVKVGPIFIYIPNTDSRVRAIKAHDLHHVLTGYATDLGGEFEIAAWELGSGCAKQSFAWLINLAGLMSGTLTQPRRMLRALARGRRSQNLYRVPYDQALLSRQVEEARAQMGLDPGAPAPQVGLGDALAYLGYLLLAVPVGIGWVVALPLMLPFAVVTAHLQRQEAVVLP